MLAPGNLLGGIKGILFDLDDTLVAFDAVTEISWKQVCTEYCSGNDKENPEVIHAAIRKVSNWYWSDPDRHRIGRSDLVSARRRVVTQAFNELNLPEPDAILVADRYSKVRLENMFVFPDAIPTLGRLKTRGIKLGLITNGDASTQNYKIDRFGLRNYFETVLIESDLGFGKPDPRIFNRALELLHFRPDEILMIGDNLVWDVSAPQSLGIRAVWYDYKGKGIPPESKVKPDIIMSSLSQLTDLLEEN